MAYHYNGNKMGSFTKITSTGIKDGEVKTADLAGGAVAEVDLASDAITSAKIAAGTVTASDLATAQDWSGKTITLPVNAFDKQMYNVGLLGFKMAVQDSLTVFNLKDGVVDEFHSEDGTDEGEGSNDTYCASCDFYQNLGSPTPYEAIFGSTTNLYAITEPTTSTAGSNLAAPVIQGGAGRATFTVPTGVTSVDIKMWGAGGGVSNNSQNGGGGGYVEGTLAVTASQVLDISVAEGGEGEPAGVGGSYGGGTPSRGGGTAGGNHPCGSDGEGGGGGGGGFVATGELSETGQMQSPQAPLIALAAGGGGGSGELGDGGGGGGGLVGHAGGNPYPSAQTANLGGEGGGGSQTAGGDGGDENGPAAGALFSGGNGVTRASGGGGGGYYGGGGGANEEAGGGGSSYYGHPQITSGSTEDGVSGSGGTSTGGATVPQYVEGIGAGASYDQGSLDPQNMPGTEPDGGYTGEDGMIIISGTGPGSTTATNIVSNAFTAGSAPTHARIVVFQENIASTTLNTDIIASISRDGGSNFTTATLVDSGYVVGSSGQRILTGTATISGQPSGTAMRWKLALANNASKIHGVSLSWA